VLSDGSYAAAPSTGSSSSGSTHWLENYLMVLTKV
jgi:hypothetical protein